MHDESIVGGGAAPRGRPQVNQEGHIQRERELENARQPGLEEKDLGLDATQYAKGVACLWPRG